MITDPISDMLNRIRNAIMRKYEQVDIPGSKVKKEIAKILKSEGFIRKVDWLTDGKHPVIRVKLKYVQDESVIAGMQRVSRPGRRVYVGKDRIPRVRAGLGVALMSTPQGMMTDKESRKRGIGGEVLCYIW